MSDTLTLARPPGRRRLTLGTTVAVWATVLVTAIAVGAVMRPAVDAPTPMAVTTTTTAPERTDPRAPATTTQPAAAHAAGTTPSGRGTEAPHAPPRATDARGATEAPTTSTPTAPATAALSGPPAAPTPTTATVPEPDIVAPPPTTAATTTTNIRVNVDGPPTTTP